MIKSTPEIEAYIKASGKPIVEITLQQLSSAKFANKEEIHYIYNKIKEQNNGNTSNR